VQLQGHKVEMVERTRAFGDFLIDHMNDLKYMVVFGFLPAGRRAQDESL